MSREGLIAGRRAIRAAIHSGRSINKLLVARGDASPSGREIIAKARAAGIVISEADRARLDALYPNHQGMLAFASAHEYYETGDILALAESRGEPALVIALDGVMDPHNLGAIIRTAECMGAHGVIIPKRRAAGLTPAAVKAAAGALEHIKVARVTNMTGELAALKERGLWVTGASLYGGDMTKADLTGPMALVIGGEGKGISRLVEKNCDALLSIPMAGKIESLNASVAAGIMMYEVLRARRGG
jgi:23S rRNA (guanosine2251-2'-O)-methyltransferase